MHKLKYTLLTGLAALTLACNNFKVTNTPEGDRIKYFVEEDGPKPKVGDMLTFNLIIKSASDSVFKDTYKEGKPFVVPLQEGTFKGSFENGLKQLAVGDSAIIYVSADSLFTRMQQPLPPGVSAGTDLSFIVKMLKIQTKEQYTKEISEKQAGEGQIINSYVSKNLPNAQKSPEGIQYIITKPGSGASPAKGDTVVVNYVGKFFDGKEFDSSKGEPLVFPIGMGYVIPGWDMTIQNMKTGEKRTVVIPSELAYGANGAGGVIDPFTPLVFDIELVNIKK